MTDDSPKQPTPPPPLGIHNLPFEILVDIFALVDVVDPWGSLGAAYGRGIAKLMLVCRNWWDMARRTPEFWRRINTAEPLDRVSLLLERSKGCTIDVRITYPWIRKYPPPWRDAVALIFPHAHRIRSLYANLHMDHYASIYQFLHGDMPALEHLYFVPMRDFRRKDRGNPAPHTDHDIAACESLSRRKYPRLRSMIAQRLYMPAPVDFWRTLRTLKMYDFPRTVSNEYLMRDVIAVLKANAGLEELVPWWYRGVPKAASTDLHESRNTAQTSRRQLFALRNLNLFSLHSPFRHAAELLDHLLLPEDIPCVDIRVSITSGYNEPAPPADEIAQMFGTLIPAHSRFLQERMSNVSFTGALGSAFYTCCTPPYALADPELAPERTAIAFNKYPGTLVPESMSLGVRCLVGILGWVPVRHLSLSGPPPPAEDDSYERMFDAFPSLEELEVSGTNHTVKADLFDALSPAPRANDGREVPRCPHLRVLVVHCARVPFWDGPPRIEIVEAIAECANARAEAGVGFQKVILHLWTGAPRRSEQVEDEEGIYKGPLERMREFVDVVEHDYSDGAAVCRRCISGY